MPKKITAKVKVDADPKRALAVLRRLQKEFPDAKCALDHETPHQLLAATILSAQCTDKRVNLVTRDLFAKYPSVEAFAHADQAEMESAVKSTGFFRNKATSLIRMSQDILEKHGGEVPRTMEELTALRGVGRKTANVLLGNAFGIPGLVVDTHVTRLSNRLGFTSQKDAVKIEFELMNLFPRKWWTVSSHLLILHGRETCGARRAECGSCAVRKLCPSADQV
ncbi:MAG: endonuclease III [Gemmatimonadota bacterium]|nr:MAG: endonuclease III [Gemmatimonadota bacterium]